MPAPISWTTWSPKPARRRRASGLTVEQGDGDERQPAAARALAALDRAAFWVVTVVMGAMVALVSVQVLLRYAFQNSIDWADDLPGCFSSRRSSSPSRSA